MERTEPLLIREIVERVLDEGLGRIEVLEHRAASLWPRIVGQGINRQTTMRYVKNGVLHVYISSSALKSEIEFSKSHIISAINAAIGQEVLKSLRVH